MVDPDDPFIRGLRYLEALRDRVPDPRLIAIPAQSPPTQVCRQIGQWIEPINARLETLLQRCQGCCLSQSRRPIVIRAAPLAEAWALDGLCVLQTMPTLVLIDMTRVTPEHWLRLVAHEFVHAHLHLPGHGRLFRQLLFQLALPLGFPLPLSDPDAPIAHSLPWHALPAYDPPTPPLLWHHLHVLAALCKGT
jgi:hypothetical protein